MLAVWREPLEALAEAESASTAPSTCSPLPAHRLMPVALVAPERGLTVTPVCGARTLAEGRPPLGIACAQQDVAHVYPLPDDPERCLDDFAGPRRRARPRLAERLDHQEASVQRFLELSGDEASRSGLRPPLSAAAAVPRRLALDRRSPSVAFLLVCGACPLPDDRERRAQRDLRPAAGPGARRRRRRLRALDGCCGRRLPRAARGPTRGGCAARAGEDRACESETAYALGSDTGADARRLETPGPVAVVQCVERAPRRGAP